MTKRHSRRKTGGAGDGNAKKPPAGSGLSTDLPDTAPGSAATVAHFEEGRRSADRTANSAPRPTLAHAIEAQRLNLTYVHEVVVSNVSLLRDAEGLQVAGADIGFCCEVIRDLLEPVIDKLRPIVVDADQGSVQLERVTLEKATELAREKLFRVHSIALLVAHALKSEKDEYAANLRLVFVAISKMMDDTLTALDTAVLGITRR